MDKIKYKIDKNKYITIPVKTILSITGPTCRKVGYNTTFVEFKKPDGTDCGFYIGPKGTFLEHNNIKYCTNADFDKLRVLLEKESICNAIDKFIDKTKEKIYVKT